MAERVSSLVVMVMVVMLAACGAGAVQNSRKGTRQVTNAHKNPHRQFQQFQIGFQLPPGTQIHQGSQPPGPAQPGFVWIQVPASPPPPQQGGYPQPPHHPPPSQPPTQVGEDTFHPPPPPSYPSPAPPPPSYPAPTQPPPQYPSPVPPYPGNQPIRPDSDFETVPTGEGPGAGLNPGQETGGEYPSPLLQHCLTARGQFPSPDSCSNFINCWDETVVEQQCPGGLVFNIGGFCDYPENVDCSDRGGPNTEVESMDENASCPTPYGSYRSSTSCGIFYICNNGIPFRFECPAGLNYNTNLGVCDYPYRVDCGDTPSERPEVPTSVDNVGEELPPDSSLEEKHKYYGGLKQVPANMVDSRVPCRSKAVFRLNPSCTSVSLCRNGFSTVISCATGTAWDSRANKCINIYQARC